jgi:flagellar protein FlaG
MANVSISELVLFIAALTVAAGVATTLTANVTDISNAVSERGGSVADKIETDVEVISDPGSPSSIYDNDSETVTVLVKNTGEQTFAAEPSQVDVLVDGSYETVDNVTVVGSESTWRTGEVARVNVSTALSSGEHRVVVYVDEDKEVLRFRT